MLDGSLDVKQKVRIKKIRDTFYTEEFGAPKKLSTKLHRHRLQIRNKYMRVKTGVCRYIRKRGEFEHGGMYHQDAETNNMLASCPHMLELVPVEPFKYRPGQKFWNYLYHLLYL